MTTKKDTPSWFSTGNDLDNFFPERSASANSNKKWPAFRFWLTVGDDRNVIFLDDESFRLWEHKLFMNGKYQYYTCLEQMGQTCPLCKAAAEQADTEFTIKAQPVVAYSVLDITPYTSKAGKVVRYSKKLFVLGETSVKKLAVTRNNQIQKDVEQGNFTAEDNPGLAHAKVSIARTEKKSSAAGDNFEFWARITDFKAMDGLEKITAEELAPINYEEELAPKTVEELETVVEAFKLSRGTAAPATNATTSVDYS